MDVSKRCAWCGRTGCVGRSRQQVRQLQLLTIFCVREQDAPVHSHRPMSEPAALVAYRSKSQLPVTRNTVIERIAAFLTVNMPLLSVVFEGSTAEVMKTTKATCHQQAICEW